MSKKVPFLSLALALVALPAHAFGGPGDGQAKEVVVTMSEFAYTVSDSVFTVGVPYKFVVTNEGRVAHEMAVVPRGAADPEGALLRIRGSEGRRGATVEREITFAEAGEFDLSCYLPTHYESGMVLPVRVQAAP